ncbi:hypothetical protein LTS09_017952 [Friedmanniomyces endolithicus]|nr:hypothetical protein LTS09_017952 [Friedmanniomyces endolithicus]
MEHFANFMALGVRENERLEREKSARAAKEPSTAAASPPTDNTGTFGRRTSKRHAVEARFNEERRDKRVGRGLDARDFGAERGGDVRGDCEEGDEAGDGDAFGS